VIRGEEQKVHEFSFSFYTHYQRMVTDGCWKMIRYYRDAWPGMEGDTDTLQLFDLTGDPWETANIADHHRDVVYRLATELEKWQRAVGDPLLHE